MSEDDDIGDASAYAHLPSGQRLYHLLLDMVEEQVRLSNRTTVAQHYAVLAELWSDIDEIAALMLQEDPEDEAADDYRKGWAALNGEHGDPREARWTLDSSEARERSRVIKRFMLRAGPLSLRRRKGDSSKDYWSQEALEFE